jgi:hypothetical protein
MIITSTTIVPLLLHLPRAAPVHLSDVSGFPTSPVAVELAGTTELVTPAGLEPGQPATDQLAATQAGQSAGSQAGEGWHGALALQPSGLLLNPHVPHCCSPLLLQLACI